jgi:hypothetical protein
VRRRVNQPSEALAIGRKLVCVTIIAALPSSLAAQDSSAAMLHGSGVVWINGSAAPASSALFRDDVVQTQGDGMAKIDASGSSVTVLKDTLVQFEGDELSLEHGSLQLSTSRSMRVRVGCITVVPVTSEWTQYDVTDVDGKVTVLAHQRDTRIEARVPSSQPKRQASAAEGVIVHEGEQKTREENCAAAAKPPSYVDAKGAILNSIWAKTAAAAVVGGITCWALCRGDDPISPYHP